MAKILVLENHWEIFRISKFHCYAQKWNYFWHFRQFLLDNNHEVSNFKKGSVTTHDLKGYDMVILGLPIRKISKEEIKTILDFVSEGGGLILAGGVISWPKQFSFWSRRDFPRLGGVLLAESTSGNPEDFLEVYIDPLESIKIINRLAIKFGIIFNTELLQGGKNCLIEDPTKFGVFSSRYKTMYPIPLITKFVPHPIVKGISELAIVDGAPLQINENVQPIGISDGDTEPPNSIVLATTQFDDGKVVAISSPSTFIKNSLSYGLYIINHLNFSYNLINWLAN